jgi:S-adenosylmethionine decarboxylase
MSGIGLHLIADFYDCDPNIINDKVRLHKALESAATVSGATIIKTFLHKFSPQGVSGVIVIAESHISIHTWPEHNFAAVDIFTCGDKVEPRKAIHYLEAELHCQNLVVRNIDRGSPERNE